MAFDPFKPNDLGRFRQSLQANGKRWNDHLKRRMAMLKQVAGFHFGAPGEGSQDHIIFPMLGLAMKVFTRLISSNDPRAHISHWNPDYDVAVHELKLALDDEFEQMDLGASLNAVTVESFFLMGVCKIGKIQKGDVEEVGGYANEIGSCFVDPVLAEDYIFDMRSRRWKQIGYEGDWSRVPLEWAQENKRFRKIARQHLSTTNDMSKMPFSGNMRRIRSQVLSTGSMQPLEAEYEDSTEIGTFFFPREQKILVIDRNCDHVLQWEDWEGPKCGPYRKLGYNYLPGNLVPLPPLAELMDQHLSANELANVTIELAKNQKDILGVTGKHGKQDGEAIRDANRMDVVALQDPKNVQQFKFNGPDQQLWALSQMIRELFGRDAGNLDALAGLGPQSGTVGQDELLMKSSSRQIQDMQDDATKLAQYVMTDVAWYIKHDPTWKRKLVKTLEGSQSVRIPFTAQPYMIPGEFEDYRIKLEPYSTRPKTPEQRAAQLTATIKDIITPLQTFLQGQGVTINVEKLFKMLAVYTDQPELADILVYTQGEQEPPPGPRGRKPPETKRIYERRNIPQSTMAGRNKVLGELAAGGNPQPKERALAAR